MRLLPRLATLPRAILACTSVSPRTTKSRNSKFAGPPVRNRSSGTSPPTKSSPSKSRTDPHALRDLYTSWYLESHRNLARINRAGGIDNRTQFAGSDAPDAANNQETRTLAGAPGSFPHTQEAAMLDFK